MRSPVALHVRVTDDVAALTELLKRLEEELPEKKKNPYGGHGTGKGGHPPLTSWNGQVAMLVMDIHAGARDLETDLKYQVTRRVRAWRGGSDRNTAKCLASLPGLCAGLDYAAVNLACKKLESWIWRARMVLGDVEPFSRLPRLPGRPDFGCPFCKTPGSLRVHHGKVNGGLVICLKPTCRDSQGNRPRGRIEEGRYSEQWLIAWDDGTTGVEGAAA